MCQLQLRALLVERSQDNQRERERPVESEQDDNSVFGLAHIKKQIEEAVADANRCDEAEKKVKIKDLRLRWHPDKNPVLQEFATEVTKIINEAIQASSS